MADQPPQTAGQPAAAAPEPPKGGGMASMAGSFFSSSPKKPAATGTAQVADLATDISNASTRLRILEERYENLRQKMLVIEQNMLQSNKKAMTEIRASDDQVKDFGRTIEQMKEELRLIVRELKLTAKSDEMQQLKKYISVWEPLNFVTRKEVGKIIRDELEDKLPQLAESGFFEEEIKKSIKSALNEKKSNND